MGEEGSLNDYNSAQFLIIYKLLKIQATLLYINIYPFPHKSLMKFFFIFTKKCVPQWKQCYYDYANIKSLIILCKKAYAIRCNIEDLARQDNYHMDQNQNLIQNRQMLHEIKMNKCERIDVMMVQANILFYQYHSICKRVVFLFCQYKIHQLNARLNRYSAWQTLVQDNKNSLTELLSNCYAENIKLETMTQIHLQAYQKIHKKHEKSFKMFGLSTPSRRTARLARTLLDMDRYTSRLEQTLDSYQQIIKRQTKYKLEEEIEPSPFKVSLLSYLFGLMNGFSICVLVASIILLAVDVGDNRPGDTALLQKKIMFENQYRLWKGTGCIILYIWIFALSFSIYEKKGINYNLIFDYKTKNQKSAPSLGVATFLTVLWSTFFVFYCMDLVGIYHVAQVQRNPRIPISIFFPVIILFIFVLFIVIQFIKTRRGVVFFALTILKIVLSPFGFYEMIFGVIWATEQLLSLVIILYDVAYTLCYYIKMLRTPASTSNVCFNFIVMVQIMAITIFIIRFLQSIRMGIENKEFWLTRQMFRAIRAVLNIIVVALSIASTKTNWVILWFWVAFAIICGIYSFVIDFLLDWSLFFVQRDENGKLILVRRQQNILKIHTINFMMAVDLICRFSFSIMVCPRIIFTYVGYPQLVMAIAEGLQMCRRLIWNVLRVENEQVKNNYFFQIRANYDMMEKKIIKQFEKNNIKYLTPPPIENERTFVEVETLRDYIRQKNRMKEKIIEFYQKNDELLQKFEDEAQTQIIKIVGEVQ